MASLNLVEWRKPLLHVVLRRQAKSLCFLAMGCVVLVGFYYALFYRRLNEFEVLQQQHAFALGSYSTLQTKVQALNNRQRADRLRTQQHRDHAASLSLFIQLLEVTVPAITINAIDWLNNELKITGAYASTDAIKQLQLTLSVWMPDAISSVRFSAPNRFTIQLNFNPQ